MYQKSIKTFLSSHLRRHFKIYRYLFNTCFQKIIYDLCILMINYKQLSIVIQIQQQKIH